jgi:DnaK suppressor protein
MADPGEDDLRRRYLPRMQEELRGLRAASDITSDDRKPVELDQQSVGRLSRMDAMQQQAMAAAQEARRHGRMRALEAAIRRLEEGEFGWCEDCGEFIGQKRLDLDPTFVRCRDCAP